MFTKAISSLRKFHSDEEGLEALQVVMIISIAAMILIAVCTLWKEAHSWMIWRYMYLRIKSDEIGK